MQAAIPLVNGTGGIPELFRLSSFATIDSSGTTVGVLVGLTGSVQPSPTLLLRMEVLQVMDQLSLQSIIRFT